VLANVRDVVVLGKESVTCLSCHDIHGQSSKKHHRVAKSDYCLNCHHPTGPMKTVKVYEVQSERCGY
jgi:predicted CXXCH cytochrome family protein